MVHAVKRLALGLFLIAAASALLLVSDLGRQRPSTSPLLRTDDLLNRFEEVRRADQLDESAAEMLRRLHV
jgi:hypothetical protein